MPSETRLDWHEYFIGVAFAVRRRAACNRRQIGAVLVRDNRIIATGYNGAPAGHRECTDGACPRGQRSDAEVPSLSAYAGAGSCIAIHAEHNAIIQRAEAAPETVFVSWHEMTMYTSYKPCDTCVDLMTSIGIRRWAFAVQNSPMIGGVTIHLKSVTDADVYARDVVPA